MSPTNLADAATEILSHLPADASRRLRAVPAPKDGFTAPRKGSGFSRVVAALPGRLRDQSPGGTGLLALDWLLGGLVPGKLTFISGRRGSGKTSLLLSIARHAALSEKRYVAALMIGHRPEKIQRMMTSSEAGVPLSLLGSRPLLGKVRDAEHRLSRSGLLHVCSQPRIELQKLIDFAHRIAGRFPGGLLLIDNIHQIVGGEGETWSASEEWRSALVRALRNLARASGLAIVVICDSAPGTERRRDRRLQLSDLDGTSALEDHADAVLLLQAGRPSGLRQEAITLSVAKNRNGATGDVEVLFNKDSFLFLPGSDRRLSGDQADAWSRNPESRSFRSA